MDVECIEVSFCIYKVDGQVCLMIRCDLIVQSSHTHNSIEVGGVIYKLIGYLIDLFLIK